MPRTLENRGGDDAQARRILSRQFPSWNRQGVPGGIARVVADAFFVQHMTASQRATATSGGGVNVPTATLRRYAGKYEMTTLGSLLMTVELQGRQLQIQLPGQPALPLRPTSMTSFEVVGAPARITFNTAADSTVEGITFQRVGSTPADAS